MSHQNKCEDYTVGFLCALPVELDALRAMLDDEHEVPQQDKNDMNAYSFGSIAGHNVVLSCPPAAQTGTSSAAAAAAQMMVSFRCIRFGLMVGIGSGVPGRNADIRLGDVVVSHSVDQSQGGVVQYHFEKTTPNSFARTGLLNSPPPVLLSAVAKIRANHREIRSKLSIHTSQFHDVPNLMLTPPGPDNLFEASYNHIGGTTCEACSSQKKIKRKSRKMGEVDIHYGLVASGNQAIRDGSMRENASKALGGVLCFEMEAAGLMRVFPCLVIRGICDYADSHKNSKWQAYAAATAAAYAKELLLAIQPIDVEKIPEVSEMISEAQVSNCTSFSPEGVSPVNRPVDRASEMGELGTDQINLGTAKKTDARMLHPGFSQEFEIIEKPRQYFKKGRFFMLHWSEPTGVNSSMECVTFQKIRRFMVIRGRPAHCLCLVVHTYGRQGTSKIDARASDHAAVIPAGKSVVLHPDEKELKKDPIQIIVEDAKVELDHTARLDFSRVYTIEYNLPVRNIGRILPKDLGKYERYFITSVDIRPEDVKVDEGYQRDGLRTLATIDTVVQLTDDVLPYLNNIKDAPNDCKNCVQQIYDFRVLLVRLKIRLSGSKASEPWYHEIEVFTKNDLLNQYTQTLQNLLNMVIPLDKTRDFTNVPSWIVVQDDVVYLSWRAERLKSDMSDALKMIHFKLSETIKKDTASNKAKIRTIQASTSAIETIINTLNTETQGMKDDMIATCNAISNYRDLQLHNSFMEWLSPTDFQAQQHNIISRRQDGTSQWLLDSATFQSWREGSNTTLFCHGTPGAGKTMMAAVIIDYLDQTTHSSDIGLAYMFCSYRAQIDQSVLNLLSTVLKQLVKSRPDIATSIICMRNQRESKPSLDELMQVLAFTCSLYSTIYIIVDALDECTKQGGARHQLIKRMRDLQAHGNVRLLFTSRCIPEVTKYFESDPQLEVRASEEDVRCFVVGQLPQLPPCIQKSEDLKNDVQTKIVEAVDGMFLLAALYIDSLRDQTSPKKVRAKLARLQEGSEVLNHAYKNELDRIEEQLPGHRLLAKQALCWITYAQRPLTTQELRHALIIEPGESTLDYENIDELEDIISVCAGLIIVDEESSAVHFVHDTIQEYFKCMLLEQNSNVQEDIAVACLTYLLFDAFQSGRCSNSKAFEQRLSENQLFDYSARYWSEHIRPLQCSHSASKLALTFLRNSATVDSVIQATSTAEHKMTGYDQEFGFPDQTSGLHLTAGYGLFDLTQRLVVNEYGDNAIDVDLKNSDGRSPLSYAAEGGHEQVVKLLVNEGADVNAVTQSGRYQTALIAASARGHEQVVKLLLEKGAEVNAQGGGHFGTALQAASECGHEQVVKLLLEKGADVNAQ
ncbi:MAG: hypothetical protein Q9165_001279 [Trypethelium subeluteriae]